MPLRSISYASPADWPHISSWLARRDAAEDNVEPLVRDILARVRADGDEAVAEYTRRFDCPGMTAGGLRVALSDIAGALGQIPACDAAIIREAAANIRDFHQRQKHNSWITTPTPGTTLGQPVLTRQTGPASTCPGPGRRDAPHFKPAHATYPAQVAGVRTICVVVPAAQGRKPQPSISSPPASSRHRARLRPRWLVLGHRTWVYGTNVLAG